jgi:hypothetical protein
MSFKDAFALPPEGEKPILTERQGEILDKLAQKVVVWKMTVPAIMFLETARPLSYVGSQAMVFFEPMVKAVFNVAEYDEVRILMEDRRNVEELLLRIERFDREAAEKEKAAKKEKRFLGWLRRKKTTPPDPDSSLRSE